MLKKAMETPEKNSLDDIETDFVNHAIEKSKELTIFLAVSYTHLTLPTILLV